MATTVHHLVLIVGGGTAGISVAARLRRAGVRDVALLDPAATHYYQPLWTLVGGGRASIKESARPERSVMPADVTWIPERADGIDPDAQTVSTDRGHTIGYGQLVVCPGIQLDWATIPGVAAAITMPHTSSNYRHDLAPKTWDLIRATRSGTAVFTMPAGPIKCAGAPQKIAYLAADYWREQGVPLMGIVRSLAEQRKTPPGRRRVSALAAVGEAAALRAGLSRIAHGRPWLKRQSRRATRTLTARSRSI